jgi:hypothetical protein
MEQWAFTAFFMVLLVTNADMKTYLMTEEQALAI